MAIISGPGEESNQDLPERNRIKREAGGVTVISLEEGSIEVVRDKKLVKDNRFFIDPCSRDTNNKYSKRMNKKIEDLVQAGILPEGVSFTGVELTINNIDITKFGPSTTMRFPEIDIPGKQGSLRAMVKVRTLSCAKLPKEAKDITFISGACLFSVPSAQAVCEDGSKASLVDVFEPIEKKIVGLDIDDEFSFYEADTIFRSTSLMKAAANGTKAETRAVFQVPREEYYIYALELVEQGLMPKEVYSKWVKEVDKRAAKVIQKIAASSVGIGSVKITNPLNAANEILRQADGTQDALVQAANALSEKDSLWKALLVLSPPKTLKDLNGLSYIYTYVKNSRTNGVEGACAIAIENPCEEKIFVELQRTGIAKALAKRDPMSIAALYVQERAMGKKGEGEMILPGPMNVSNLPIPGSGRVMPPMSLPVPMKQPVIFVNNNYWSGLTESQVAEVLNDAYGDNKEAA